MRCVKFVIILTRLDNEDLEALGHCVHACVDELPQVGTHLCNRLNRDLLSILGNHFCPLFVLQASSNPGSLNDSVEREGENVVDKEDCLEDAEHPVPDESHLAASHRLLTYRCSIHRRLSTSQTGEAAWAASSSAAEKAVCCLLIILNRKPSLPFFARPSHPLLRSSSGSSYRL